MKTKLLATAAALGVLATVAMAPETRAETVKVMTFAGIVDYQKEGWNRILDEFAKAHPDIEIEVVAVPYAEIVNQSTVQILGGNLSVAADGDVWVYPMPTMPDGTVRQMANDNVLVLTEASEVKEAAATFIDYVLTNEPTVAYYAETSDQVVTGYSPILQMSPVFADDLMVQAFVEWMPVSNAVPLKNPKWDAIADLMAVTMQKVTQGADPATELARAQRDAERLLRR